MVVIWVFLGFLCLMLLLYIFLLIVKKYIFIESIRCVKYWYIIEMLKIGVECIFLNYLLEKEINFVK